MSKRKITMEVISLEGLSRSLDDVIAAHRLLSLRVANLEIKLNTIKESKPPLIDLRGREYTK